MPVVVSALIGPADDLLPPPHYPGTRFVCVTDREVPGWECVPPPPGYDRIAARRAKMQVLTYAESHVIWMDASFDVLVDPSEIVAEADATGCAVVGFRHPDRNRISDEARKIVQLGYAPNDRVEAQIAHYQGRGFDTDDAPQRVLTTGGLLVLRNTPDVSVMMSTWLAEVEHFTIRDQLSLDYAAWVNGVQIGYLPGSYRDNRYFRYNRRRHGERRC